MELQFNYISTDKQRKRYILLDDEPQQALQVKTTAQRVSFLCIAKLAFYISQNNQNKSGGKRTR